LKPQAALPTYTATMEHLFNDIDASAKQLYQAYRSNRLTTQPSSANEQLFCALLRSVDKMRLFINKDFEALWLMEAEDSQRRASIPVPAPTYAAQQPSPVQFIPLATRHSSLPSAILADNSSFSSVNVDRVHPNPEVTCDGCLTDQPNQLAHIGIGGCLYNGDE